MISDLWKGALVVGMVMASACDVTATGVQHSSLAGGAPVVSAEHQVDEPVPIQVVSDGSRIDSRAAWNGTSWLVAWNKYSSTAMTLEARLIGASGEPLGTGAQALGASSFLGRPSVASDGAGFLAVWPVWDGIAGRFVSADGTPSGAAESMLAPGGHDPAVAWNGGHYLVVWSVDPSGWGTQIQGARYLADGTRVGNVFTISPPGQVNRAPAVAASGTSWLVSWAGSPTYDNYTDPYAALVDGDGSVHTAFLLSAARGEQHGLALAGSNDGWFAVWKSNQIGAAPIQGARISGAGVLLDEVPVSVAATSASTLSVARSGSDWQVVWEDTVPTVYGRRVTTAGQLVEPAPVTFDPGPGSELSAAVDSGPTSLITYTYQDEIWALRIAPDGAVLDPGGLQVGTGARTLANNQDGEAVASNPFADLLTFSDDRTGDRVVRGALIAHGGDAIGGAGFTIGDGTDPSVATDGTDFLVVWKRWSDPGLRLAHVTPAGEVAPAGGQPVPIFDAGAYMLYPRIAYGAGRYLVVWEQGNAEEREVAFAVLDQTGGPLVQAQLLGRGYNPTVTFGDNQFLIGWDRSEVTSLGWRVHLARVALDGTVLDPGDGLHVSAELGYETAPGLGFDGTNYLVTWNASQATIRAARLSRDGTILDTPITIGNNAFNTRGASVVYDGASFLVYWSLGDLRGARVSSEGTLLDPGGFAISAHPLLERDAVATTTRDGLTLFAYRREDQSPGVNSERVWFRWLSYAAPVQPDAGVPEPDAGVADASPPDADGT